MTRTVQAFVNFFWGRGERLRRGSRERQFLFRSKGGGKKINKPAVDLGDDYRRAIDFE